MVVQLLLLLSMTISMSQSVTMDYSSIHMVPHLYRLCWKQNGSKLISDYIMGIDEQRMTEFKFPIFEESEQGDNLYCIEHKDKYSSFKLSIPIESSKEHIFLYVNFSLPLTPVLRIIRMKIVSGGVHFQLNADFVGISAKVAMYCNGVFRYKWENDIISSKFEMDSVNKFYMNKIMNPDTEFDIYYSCMNKEYMRTSSEFVNEHGIVFSEEITQSLQPFLQFPFRQILVGQFKNPQNTPEIYNIVIYEINNLKIEKCLKIFRIYSMLKSQSKPTTSLKNCTKVAIEDLGTLKLSEGDNIYVALNMGVPLKMNTRYKFSIWWTNRLNELTENFIYFEPLANERSGIIDSDIYNFNSSAYETIRKKISDIRQNVIDEYSKIMFSGVAINISKFDEIKVLPSISTHRQPRITQPNIISLIDLNKKCKEIPSCGNGLHPFFYVMTSKKLSFDYNVQLMTIPKKESFQLTNLTLVPNSLNYTFKISWNINQNGHQTSIPSSYAIQIRMGTNDGCFGLYVLTCSTCNKQHMKISGNNFKETLKKWETDCKSSIKLKDYYESMDTLISFTTKEMIPEENFRAEIYSINLNDITILGKTKEHFIKVSLWRKYKTVVISVICSIFGIALLIFVFIMCKNLLKDVTKDTEMEDTNKYCNEDEV